MTQAREWLVRYAFADGRPAPSGGRWVGVVTEERDPLNALIRARRDNRTIYPIRDMVVLDVVVVA